jgi:hypothetical protein
MLETEHPLDGFDPSGFSFVADFDLRISDFISGL